MSKDLVVMDNNLVTASYKLTVNESRLLLVAIAQMPKDAPVDPKQAYYITKEDFIKLGVEPKNVAREIRSACSDLLDRKLMINTPLGPLGTHWVHNVLFFKSSAFEKLKNEYATALNDEDFINILKQHNLLDSLEVLANSDDNLIARVILHEDIIPYLSDLKSQFTQFMLEDMAGFSSFYSFRIYQMLMQFKSTGYLRMHLDTLRDALVLGNKYEATKDLKVRVIETAVKEINEKSPVIVTYELIKTGRKFTHLELKFKQKVIEIKECKQKPDAFFMTDAQLGSYSKKLSRLPELGYLAVGNEGFDELAERIKEMLKDIEKQSIFIQHLKNLGFKF